VVKVQGRQGEVAADLYTDFPERFAERRRVFALSVAGTRRELELESHWGHKGRVILKFRGVESISEAERLVGSEIQIPRRERATLDAGLAYVSDLVGCSVTAVEAEREQHIGEIAEVQFGAGEAPLLVIRQGKQERLVPFAEEFLGNVDLEHKQVRLKLPEGMLEIDAPLSEEEKREQQRGNFKASGGDQKGSRELGPRRHKK
jgi:16S rRNA processing protein RimM